MTAFYSMLKHGGQFQKNIEHLEKQHDIITCSYYFLFIYIYTYMFLFYDVCWGILDGDICVKHW